MLEHVFMNYTLTAYTLLLVDVNGVAFLALS